MLELYHSDTEEGKYRYQEIIDYYIKESKRIHLMIETLLDTFRTYHLSFN